MCAPVVSASAPYGLFVLYGEKGQQMQCGQLGRIGLETVDVI